MKRPTSGRDREGGGIVEIRSKPLSSLRPRGLTPKTPTASAVCMVSELSSRRQTQLLGVVHNLPTMYVHNI